MKGSIKHIGSFMLKMKTCFKCGEEKPLSAFYRHKAMSDGHLNKCIVCAKDAEHKRRLKNIDYIRAYDRDRSKNPDRMKFASEHANRWREKDSRIVGAHNAVARAIKKGLLCRQPCVKCGADKAYAHHENYNLYLDVVWLCQVCHKQRHKEMILNDIDPFKEP